MSAFVQSVESRRAFADWRSASTCREASSNFCSETSRSTSLHEAGVAGASVGVRVGATATAAFFCGGAVDAVPASAASADATATPTHRPGARIPVILPTQEPARPQKFLGSALQV